jgi:hypothetical protein
VITTVINKFENHSLLGYDSMYRGAGVPALHRTVSTEQCSVAFTNNLSPGLISSQMQFLFVRVVPKCLNCFILSNYLLPETGGERRLEKMAQ